MTNRKNNKGFAARIGSFFGKKPEHHNVPHIYISTESDTKKRKVKAKERFARERAARQAVAAPPAATVEVTEEQEEEIQSGVGKIQKASTAEVESSEALSAIDEAASLKEEEGFMQKVHLQKKDTAPRKGIGLWTMIRDRFSSGGPAMRAVPTDTVEPIDPAQDSFLQHASVAPAEPAIRTESSTPAPAGAVRSAIDEVTDDVRPAPGKSDAEKRQEVAAALKENADIVAVPVQKAVPAPAPLKKHVKAQQFQNKKGLQSFLTSLNYIGMGKERLMFIQNMATMLNAGLPLTDSLRTLVLETRNRSMRKLIGRIIDAVENGSPLWRAMEAQNFFSLHALALVRIGEEAGNLSENMGHLATQDEKDHALRSKVKMAMIYPTIVMVIMFIIVVGLGTFVLPNLIGVLFSLNVELPLITRIVIWCSNSFTEYGAIGVPSFVGAFILIGILSKYTRLRVVTQWVMFKIPGIGRLAREATIARFGVILGGLLKAGVPVVEAFESLVQVTPIAAYRNLYAKMLARISIGDSFSKSFAGIRGSERLLPPSVQQLVITGEKSGSLADIMLKIADIYDKKATETAEKLPIILEPMLLLFIGALVGSIALAIIIPIYSIVGNVGG